MKITSCYIENFGQFKQLSLDFSDSITSYCERNGYGKTTIAAFIKAMFYGLESSRIKKKFTDRMHFAPFAGGKYGGSLVFEFHGKEYKIERFFDEVSDAKDSCKVLCNGVPCTEFGDNIGEKVFGIDKQSFERLMFITSEDIEISSTSSINKKMNNVVQDSANDENFDRALEIIKEKQKSYRSKKGGSGLLDNELLHKIDLENKIRNLESIGGGLSKKYERSGKLDEQIRFVKNKLTETQKNNAVLENWDNYDRKCNEIAVCENSAKKIKAMYPNGMSSQAELAAAKKALKEYNVTNAQLLRSSFTGQDDVRLKNLQKLFSDGIPSDETLHEKEKKIETLSALQSEANLLKARTLSIYEEKLKKQFAYRSPSESEMEQLDKLYAKYKSLEEKSASLPNYVTESAATEAKAVPKPNILLLIFGIVLLAVGIGTLFVQIAVGTILIVLGVGALLAVAFLYLNKKSTYAMSQIQAVQKENPEKINADAEKRIVAEQLLNLFFLPYGYALENGISYSVDSLKRDVREWYALTEREKENSEALSQNSAKIENLSKRLEEFFSEYGLEGKNYNLFLSQLRATIDEFTVLQNRKENALSEEKDVRAKFDAAKSRLENFCKKYALNFAEIDRELEKFEKDFAEYDNLLNQIEIGKMNAEKFKAEKNLTARPNTTQSDVAELNVKYDELRDARDNLNREIAEDESNVEKLDELKNAKEQATEKINEYVQTLHLLEVTEECLKEADENLKDKYIKPIRDIFIEHALTIEGVVCEKLTMNSDLEIFYERNGQNKSEKYLSAGQKSIVALCFRLALIKNMYSDENPFLILDDPFVALDAEHFEKSKVLLETLAAEFQIVYFTCHESRKI